MYERTENALGSKFSALEFHKLILDCGPVPLKYVDAYIKEVMNYSKETGIEIGDYIETSGAGGIIPAGIYIGKVTEVRSDVTGVSQEAIIQPGVDFSNLKEVMVILN